MFSITLENEYGERMELTHNAAYTVESTDGFDPPDAVINTTGGAGVDGSVFNSAHMENRVVTLTIAINSPAEENRLALYRYFKPKARVRFYYKTESRSVYCDGYVQTMPIDYFGKKEIIQVTAVCPNPYLINTQESVTDFSYVEALFEFPFSIGSSGEAFSELHTTQEETVHNDGDLETGALIELHATGAVQYPEVMCADTGEFIKVDINMVAGDSLIINTRKKQKSITLVHAGVSTNVIGDMTPSSTFFQLRAGDSALIVDAQSGAANIETTVTIEGHFAGV